MTAGRKQPTGPGKLGPVTIGITGAVGTSGVSIIVARLASGPGGAADTCLMLAGYFITTSLIAALGLILNYRLEKAGLRTRDSAAQRCHELSATRLDLQRGIIDKIRDGGDASHAYQAMTAADALCALSRSSPESTAFRQSDHRAP
jgi:hypothetical protein